MPATDPATLPQCDLVMKGGITSGVVYPKLIARLAGKYRFRSVGGSSAGAIAAAGCAAAEYGRQHRTNPGAFADLAKLPDDLGAGSPSRLFQLFRPAPELREHFAVLVGALNKPDKVAAVGGALQALLFQFWPLALVGVLPAIVISIAAVRGVAPMLDYFATTAWALAIVAAWLVCLGLAWWLRWQWRKAAKLPRLVLFWIVTSIASTAVLLWAASHAAAGSPLVIATAALAAALPLCLAFAMALCAGRFAYTLLAGLQRNRWGLCSGHDDKHVGATPPLTDWLTTYFNNLAGMDPAGRPLAFGDLWGMPVEPIEAKAPDPPPPDRKIDLQVMTTAVSQRMCYAIPLREGIGNFYYDPVEWKELFPPSVMEWLARVSAVQDAGQPARTRAGDAPLCRLPSGPYLPVVVAVRLSLSFPVLLSALPLYAIDHSVKKDIANNRAQRIWFSDGGIASNIPLHFFDAPLPGHPTFAINLKGVHPEHPIDPKQPACTQDGRVYLPQNNSAGRTLHWTPQDDTTKLGLFAFLFGIVETMHNWRDEIQFPYPGYRDRIAQISQLPREGGLNLNMPKRDIDALSEAGECAAEKFVDRFVLDPAVPRSDGWENHQDIRLRTFLALMEELTTNPTLHDPVWTTIVQRAVADNHYTSQQGAVADDILDGLRAIGVRVKASNQSLVPPPAAPRPRPQFTIAPHI